MGCNTSQELKTKDATTAAAEAAECETKNSPLKNDVSASANNEQNANTEAQKGVDACASPGAANTHQKTASSASSLTHNLTNHSKSNSIITNGDANKHHAPRDAATTAAEAAASAEQFSKQNGVYSSTFTYGESSGGTSAGRQCDKAEISELNDMDLGEDEAKAATKIQAVFRGHQVRNTMKKSETKTPNTTPTAAATNKNGAEAAAAAADPTKEELEAEFDPNDKELCGAALKIQAAFRGHLTRKVVKEDAPEDVDIQEITKKVAEELDIDLTDPELNKAATKIQASFRGHKTRRDTQPE